VSDYTPPLDDIRFTLDHLCDLDGLAALEPFAHADPDTVHEVLAEVARFMADVVGPLNANSDEQGLELTDDNRVITPDGFKEAYAKYVEYGYGAIAFDPEYDGGGFPQLVGVVTQEMITSACLSFSMAPLLTQGGIEMPSEHADDEQKAAYLPKMITGEWSGTMNLTESQAGSDVGALTTRAVPAGDGSYRITGTKIFISFGEHDMADNIVHLVLARTPDAPPGTKGISCFIVPKFLLDEDGDPGVRNDVTCVSIEHKMGINASPTCTLSFGDDGEGAVGYLIGEENQGMRYMFTMMNTARLAVGLQGLSLAERATQQAVEFAHERRQGTAVGAPKGEQSLIVEHPDVRRMLLTMRAQVEAMRGVMYHNAQAIDFARHHPDADERRRWQETADLFTPLSKAWGTDLGCEITSINIQVHGGMGYVEETGAAQHFRDARIAPIYEGTNGIQAMDLVGRKLPMRGGGVITDHLDTMAGTAEALTTAGGDLAGLGEMLAAGVDAGREVTTWMLENGFEDPNDALAGSVPFLRLLGIITGGWIHARAALAATAAIAEGDGDTDFLKGRLATARFYGDHILPEAQSLVRPATAGSAQLFAANL
jgi:alkylation response protein AidB-like acyl-CoA dehydrogenase